MIHLIWKETRNKRQKKEEGKLKSWATWMLALEFLKKVESRVKKYQSNQIRPNIQLRPMSVEWNLTQFHAWFSQKRQAEEPNQCFPVQHKSPDVLPLRLPFAPCKESNLAIAHLLLPRRTSLCLLPDACGSLSFRTATWRAFLSASLDAAQFMNCWIKARRWVNYGHFSFNTRERGFRMWEI